MSFQAFRDQMRVFPVLVSIVVASCASSRLQESICFDSINWGLGKPVVGRVTRMALDAPLLARIASDNPSIQLDGVVCAYIDKSRQKLQLQVGDPHTIGGAKLHVFVREQEGWRYVSTDEFSDVVM